MYLTVVGRKKENIYEVNEKTVASDELLIELGAKLIKKNVKFSGFGGDAVGNLYRVNFLLNDLIYIDMLIVATEMDNLQCLISRSGF